MYVKSKGTSIITMVQVFVFAKDVAVVSLLSSGVLFLCRISFLSSRVSFLCRTSFFSSHDSFLSSRVSFLSCRVSFLSSRDSLARVGSHFSDFSRVVSRFSRVACRFVRVVSRSSRPLTGTECLIRDNCVTDFCIEGHKNSTAQISEHNYTRKTRWQKASKRVCALNANKTVR